MAKVIIGIHGLGNKPDVKTITQWWKQSIEEGLSNQGFTTKIPEFKLVYWADILYPQPLDNTITDPEHPLYVDEKYSKSINGYKPHNHKWLKRILRFTGNQLNKIFLREDFSLKYTFIPDYFLRKYFRELDVYYADDQLEEDKEDCKLKKAIKQRLADTLEQHKNDEIMLIAHSMGSIIAFDVLSFLTPESRINTFITIGSPLGMPVVISKIASQYKINPSGKKEMVSPPGVYGNWFNFSDIADTITLNYKLSRSYKFNQHAIKPRDFSVVNDYHNQEGIHNPHKSFGYLRTKKLAWMVNDFILSDD